MTTLTEQGKEAALAALRERRANRPRKIINENLPAGSPMYFYCIACGCEAYVMPESYINPPPKLCRECIALKTLGWLDE